MKEVSPKAVSVNAAICKQKGDVHYIFRPDMDTVSGVLEFMTIDFIKQFHLPIYDASVPPGNLSSLDWTQFPLVYRVDCLSLTQVLHRVGVAHINFFILDTEGAEMEVLQTIDFEHIRFDVISVETDPVFRRAGYTETVSQFLATVGYKDVSGQQARNTCK
jgi:hypothetical protein